MNNTKDNRPFTQDTAIKFHMSGEVINPWYESLIDDAVKIRDRRIKREQEQKERFKDHVIREELSMANTKRTIIRNGQSVSCFGKWRSDSNAMCVWSFEDGFVDTGCFADGADTWEEAVEKMTVYTQRIGATLDEMQAC